MQMLRKIMLRVAIVALALAAPVAFSPSAGLAANDACAQTGTCCGKDDSCIVNGTKVADGYWQDGSGPCVDEEPAAQ